MTKQTKLIRRSDGKSDVEVVCPVSDNEIISRETDYPNLSFIDFAKKYRSQLYKDVKLNVSGKTYKIQANFCINPFCRWYGLPQHKYMNIKFQPSRYGLWGSHPTNSILCQQVATNEPEGITIPADYSSPMSNWSLAEEIKRLIDINTLISMEDEYQFHRKDCLEINKNPFDNPTSFYKRGMSTSNSQKYQCKVCKKMTNVLPINRECYTYNQKKNDILPRLMMEIVNRAPVTRTLEKIKIGSSTYYNKIEWLHRKCLEFLERHETKALKDIHFDTLWLNTDKFIYYLNNIRKKGYGNDYIEQERLLLATQIIATVDSDSRYVFRTDIAYDYEVKAEDVEKDIQYYKEDKLNTFVQKNARYRHSYYAGRKKKEDFTDDVEDDVLNRTYLDLRKDYVDGLHVNSTYTAYAQYWLLKDLLNVDKLNFVCDDDRTLINSLMRVFSEEIKNGKTNIFTCQVEKSLSKVDAHREAKLQRDELTEFEKKYGLKTSKEESAILMLAEELLTHNFYHHVLHDGKEFPIPSLIGPIEHPTPFDDEGIRYIGVLTDLSNLTSLELATELYKVDMRAVNTYFNQLRRRCSLLERPLVTARGDGKSYIYANFNPKYAHYMLTILRTYLNFCDTYKCNGKNVTPAMKLGIAVRPFSVEEIIYFT